MPLALNTWNYPLKPHNVAHYLGIYGTDSWAVDHAADTGSRATRYAHDNGFIPEGCRENGQFSVTQCFPSVQFNIWNTFAPRIHFALDVTGDRKTGHQRRLGPYSINSASRRQKSSTADRMRQCARRSSRGRSPRNRNKRVGGRSKMQIPTAGVSLNDATMTRGESKQKTEKIMSLLLALEKQ